MRLIKSVYPVKLKMYSLCVRNESISLMAPIQYNQYLKKMQQRRWIHVRWHTDSCLPVCTPAEESTACCKTV